LENCPEDRFPAHLRGEKQPDSGDHGDPTQTQASFIATGSTKKKRIQLNTQQRCQKDRSKIREIKQQIACCVLVPHPRAILEENERPPQHPPSAGRAAPFALRPIEHGRNCLIAFIGPK